MKIRPTRDGVYVKIQREEPISKGGIIIPATAQAKTSLGEIVAVGPEAMRDFKEGDVVLYDKYAGCAMTEDGAEFLLLKSEDILAHVGEKE